MVPPITKDRTMNYFTSIEEFKANTWNKAMDNSNGLDGWGNYSGSADESWQEFVVLSVYRNRDSNILDESNFECALDTLGGESDDVQVHRFGHWGCGWFELLLVNPNSNKIEDAYKIQTALQNYPVLDESDYSDRQWELYTEYAEQSKHSIACVLVRLLGLPVELENDAELIELARQLQVEHQAANGEESSLFSNEFHVDRFDDSDAEQYEQALKDIQYQNEGNQAYNLITACFGLVNEK